MLLIAEDKRLLIVEMMFSPLLSLISDSTIDTVIVTIADSVAVAVLGIVVAVVELAVVAVVVELAVVASVECAQIALLASVCFSPENISLVWLDFAIKTHSHTSPSLV